MDKGLKELLTKIRHLYRGAKIYLFGSRAKGNSSQYSDYDLIVISKGFESTEFVNRPGVIRRAAKLGIAADMLCFTPKEFQKASQMSLIIKDAMRHAIAL